jgi:steroid delta-isomerase-like uncharacterized protein
MIEEVWSRGDLAAVDYITTPEYVEYDPVLAEPIQGQEAFKQTVRTFRDRVPDLTKHVEEVLISGEKIVVQYTATGTYKGELLGVESTGKEIESRGILICTVEDGKLIKSDNLWNAFGLLQQVGVLPDELPPWEVVG